MGGDYLTTSIGDMLLSTAATLKTVSLDSTTMIAASTTSGKIAIIAGTSLDMKSTGKLSINSEEEVDIDGEVINLN